MGQCAINSREAQEKRLKLKTRSQQMLNLAVHGTGLSQWEGQVLVNTIEEVYFNDLELRQMRHGQLKYSCVSSSEPAGKPIKDCQMVTVTLTLFDDKEDKENLTWKAKNASIEQRHRRLLRISSEAMEQGGLLSQEDLSDVLMCNIRTIRRDIADLNKLGIIVPTRGTIKDIGPGVTHRALAIRLWLEGKEPMEVARHINHSLKAAENYIEKFKRVAYLRYVKKLNTFEISLIIGISVNATKTFVEIYEEYKNKAFFISRMEEIKTIGAEYYTAQGEKKDSRLPKNSTNERLMKK